MAFDATIRVATSTSPAVPLTLPGEKSDRLGRIGFFLMTAFTLLAWGSAFPAIRVALTAYSPQHVALLRFSIASLVMLALLPITKVGSIKRQDWWLLLIAAVCGISIYQVALCCGEVTVPAGTASLLMSCTPVLVGVFAAVWLAERLNKRLIFGLILSFSGAALLSLGHRGHLQLDWDCGILLSGALLSAISTTLQKPLSHRYPPLHTASYLIWLGALFMLPLSAGVFKEIAAAPLLPTLCVLYLGAIPAALGQIAWLFILRRLHASRAAMLLYLTPLLACLTAWLWLREVPSSAAMVGGALILMGVALANARPPLPASNLVQD